MVGFKYAKVASRRTTSLMADRVSGMLRAMQKRATWAGVIVSLDATPGPNGEGQFPVVSLGWYPDFGYQVHFMGRARRENHFVATGKSLSTPEVYVELDGQGQELWPSELFVPYAVAEQAVLRLVRTGKRDPSLRWVNISTFPRKAAPVRRG